MNRLMNAPWGQLAFCLLFVGFFAYHQLLEKGLISAALGGYFGIASAVSFCVLIPVYLYRLRPNVSHQIRLNGFDYSFLALLIFTFTVACVNFAVGRLSGNQELLLWSLSGIFFNIVVYLIARCYEYSKANYRVLLLAAFCVLLTVYLSSIDGRFYVWKSYLDDNATTYQGYGRTLVLLGFFLVAYSRGFIAPTLLLLAFVPALFLNGGRTELALFSVSVILMFVVTMSFRRNGAIWIMTCTLLLGFATPYGLTYFQQELPDSRILELFELSLSASANERAKLTSVAIDSIVRHPFVGDYGSYVLTESSVGYYSHNLLSAWVNLGFLGFIFYISVLVVGCYRIVSSGGIQIIRQSTQWKLAVLLTAYMVLAYVFSRNYSDEIFGAFIGVQAGLWQLAAHLGRASQPDAKAL